MGGSSVDPESENEDNLEEHEENAEDIELESMLSEYRQMFGKPVVEITKEAVVDMTKGNAITNGSIEEKNVLQFQSMYYLLS